MNKVFAIKNTKYLNPPKDYDDESLYPSFQEKLDLFKFEILYKNPYFYLKNHKIILIKFKKFCIFNLKNGNKSEKCVKIEIKIFYINNDFDISDIILYGIISNKKYI